MLVHFFSFSSSCSSVLCTRTSQHCADTHIKCIKNYAMNKIHGERERVNKIKVNGYDSMDGSMESKAFSLLTLLMLLMAHTADDNNCVCVIFPVFIFVSISLSFCSCRPIK